MTERKIALLGNQNCGKTTLFNALTGSDQYVGNWPGVTVDKVVGRVSKKNWSLIDLPGLYSLSPYSPEEIVSRDFLEQDNFDLILNVIDATHLERGLSLTLELCQFKKNMIVILNMMDKAKAMNINIDVQALENKLGIKVVPISATKDKTFDYLLKTIEGSFANEQISKLNFLNDDVKEIIKPLEEQIQAPDNFKQFIALSLLEQDSIYVKKYANEKVKLLIAAISNKLLDKYQDDPESLIATFRFSRVDEIVNCAQKKEQRSENSVSAKIDAIVTNKYLALPIFFIIVYVVYYLAVSTIGTMGTDYANDVLFGEYATNGASSLLESLNAPEWLSGLIVDGIIAGVGAVLGFLPQMIVLFLLLSFLEQSGYMTRVAFVLDRIFRNFGLSGRCFIPMVIATGCGVPALMSTKSIENINERRITIITTTFMPCSAKLPVLAMIAAAFFPNSTFIAPGVYLFAILSIIITGIILKKQSAFNEDVSPFVMELPDYHLPKLSNILHSTFERCKAFVIKAGTIIFSVVVIVWFLSNFNFTKDGFTMVDISDSLLAVIGSAIAFIFIPLGFYSWQATVAIFTGLLAKENVVGTFAVLVGLADAQEGDASLSKALEGHFPLAISAISFLLFNLFSTPCIAALGAMKRQLGSTKMFLFTIVYMLGWAYILSFIVYQIGGFIFSGLSFSIGTAIAAIFLLAIIYLLVKPGKKKIKSPVIQAKII